MYVPLALPCGIVALAFVALFVWAPIADVHTGSGYGLCTLSFLLLTCTILVVGAVTIAAQAETQPRVIHHPSVAGLLVFYFVPAIYATGFAMLDAVIVAAIAGHWRWIVGILVAELVPVLLVVPPLPALLFPRIPVQDIGFLGMLIAPAATMLAYSITRIRHPVVPAAARVPAPPR
jgi:hypothetical protein